MSILEIIFTALGLTMDAFAVSICKGLSLKKVSFKNAILVGTYFGLFQGLMPLIGYFLGFKMKDAIMSIDHWIAFILLGIIGLNMILDSFKKESIDDNLEFKTMITLAIATSIDALAIGITFAFLEVNIYFAVTLTAIITFIISALGVKIGNIFGNKYSSKAEIFGGIVLILMGIKILLEHLYII